VRRPAVLRFSAVLFSLGLLAACGSGDPDPTTSTTEAASGKLPTVTGGFGETAEITLPSGKPSTKFVADVLEEGDGPAVTDGQLIVANYTAMLWAAKPKGGDQSTDPLFDTIATNAPEPFTLAQDKALPGMIKGLVDAKVGSRMLLVIPPADGFGEEGRTDIGVGPDDTLVFVFDVLDAFEDDQAAEGTAVEPDPALPTVAEGDDGPTATIPATAAPTELLSQVLVQGEGDVVESGQLLVVQYRGQLWKDGSEFDSSWSGDSATAFPIGTGGVIPGWDKTLVGQTVGSRVLLVVPPAEGYGEAGNPPTIAGDDTLVFIVDILGAYGAAQESTPTPTESPTG
jgi:FKBP-type peptidyl-prolyl cis-trans isomerase